MQPQISLLLSFVILLGATSRGAAQEGDEAGARAIIRKALQAHGGKENLAKYRMFWAHGRGTLFLPDGTSTSTEITYWSKAPDRLKLVALVDVGTGQVRGVRVLDSEQGWQQVDGKTSELRDMQLKAVQHAAYESYVLLLLPLLEDSGFTVTLLGEVKVAGRAAVGVKVTSKDHADFSLYFDKITYLLVKTSVPSVDPAEGMVLEQYYSGYKNFSGRQFPTRQLLLVDGKKNLDSEVLEIRPLEKIEPGTFAKPE